MQRKHQGRGRREEHHNLRQGAEDPFSYWRRLPPEDLDRQRRAKLAGSISRLASIFPNWQAAMAGDAGAAVGIVLRLRPPFHISGRVDLAMSLLLNCAFENASAALVLSHALRRMQIARNRRIQLADSWLKYNTRRAAPRPQLKSGSKKRIRRHVN